MIVGNTARNTILGETIEVAVTAAQKVRGLLGRECLEECVGKFSAGLIAIVRLLLENLFEDVAKTLRQVLDY